MTESTNTPGPQPGAPATQAPPGTELPLFPLRTVLFPGGLLPLKIFEARYLDMVSACLREQQPFGVVCLTEGAEAGAADPAVSFASVGTLARIDDVDAPQAGILHIRCTGTQRFRLAAPASQDRTGLWSAPVALIPDDDRLDPPPELSGAVQALSQAAQALERQGLAAIATPLCLDQAGWVANRWCELLPLALPARQRLMELDDPLARLRVVERLLREQGVLDD